MKLVKGPENLKINHYYDTVYRISVYSLYMSVCACVFISNEHSTGGGGCIYGNGLVPSCHGEEEDGCHERGDHLTSAAPQLRGVKMLLKPLQNLT